ncbi:MAG: hypothetical protein AAF799_45925 [Myxococcota bacterium]
MRALGRAPWGLLLLAAGCVTHRGSWHTLGTSDHHIAPTDAEPAVEVVLLANLAPEDRRAAKVATRVEEILAEDRPRVVVWLGNVAGEPFRTVTPRAARRGPRCNPLESAWSTPAAARLAAAVRREAPEHGFATVGELDHRCGYGPQLRASEEGPWQMPGTHYVLRVHGDGQVRVTTSCGAGACSFAAEPTEPPSAKPLVDLVVVDLSPWLHPSADPRARRADDLEVQALEALLTAIGDSPAEAGPPRLLVRSVPIEAAAEHGLGTLWPDATFSTMPPTLRSLVVRGYFAGVLSAHDRSLTATADLFEPIKRGDRAWLEAPTFQVGAGAVSAPNTRPAMSLRRRRVRFSQAYRPDIASDHAGFAVLTVRPHDADVTLHAHRHGHWETASMTVPLRPPPHAMRTPSPPMGPCRDCPQIPANER